MSNRIIEENVEGEVDGDMSTCKYKVHKETDKEWEKGKGRQTPGKRNSPNRWQGQREAGERCKWVFQIGRNCHNSRQTMTKTLQVLAKDGRGGECKDFGQELPA